MSEVTRILNAIESGDPQASQELLPVLYDELRELAGRYLADENTGHTLQPTALVHEVYIRIMGQAGAAWETRAQFFVVASRAMRHLLIDHARRRNASKRGGNRRKLALQEIAEPEKHRDEYILALDDALRQLTDVDSQLSRLVELRFFGGLSVDETAKILGTSPTTVKRMWTVARGWLHHEISRER